MTARDMPCDQRTELAPLTSALGGSGHATHEEVVRMWHIASVTNMDQFGHNRRHSGRARTPAARQLAQPSTCPSVRPNYPSLCPGIYGISEVNRRLLGAG